MALQTVVTSDLSGSADATTVAFGLDGRAYEIDLTEKERADFDKALKKYLDAARAVGRVASTASKAKPKAAKSRAAGTPAPADIRVWAAEVGYEVPARGRIPESVVQAYTDAHA
jgi:Lsr2